MAVLVERGNAVAAADERESKAGPISLHQPHSIPSLPEQMAELNLRTAVCAILDALETAAQGDHSIVIRSRPGEAGATHFFEFDGEAIATFQSQDAERLAFELLLESRARPHLSETCCALFDASL